MTVTRRALLYSHDTFGLGHLRRSRTIALALTRADPELAALIVTGSPIAGRFDFPDRVDHVRLPGVVKLPDGDYASHNLGIPVDDTVVLRTEILLASYRAFGADLLIVDKEAWGFRNELAPTLVAAKARGTRIVLGVRDVLDEPVALRAEWDRKGHVEAIERFFDEIWVYGLPQICRPLAGLGLSPRWEAEGRVIYTGYLRRELPESYGRSAVPLEPYILVTTGGGGDGESLIDWVLSAYEHDPALEPRVLLVYGPFLPPEHRRAFDRRAARLGRRIQVLQFDSRPERLFKEAVGVIAMSGYNTFCEILSFDRPAVLAPRNVPREEQLIRARAAERLGLVRLLDETRDGRSPEAMAAAIRALPTQPRPSSRALPGMLDGLDVVTARARPEAWSWRKAGE
jgi:predicted glycosyltransferase